MRKRSIKVFLVRRRVVAVLAALALAAGIFYAVSYPGSVSAAAAKRQLPIYSVERTDGKFCSISFDAAWGNEDTQILIDILARYDIKATFFVVGDWAEKYPESVKALHDAGHEVMSHSNHHDHYNTLTAEQIIADVTASNERISASTGVTPTLIRCPYGEYDDHVISSKVMGFNGSFPRKYPAWRFRIPSVIPSRVLLRCSTAFMMNLARFSFSSK